MAKRRRSRRAKENPIELLPLLLIAGGALAVGGAAYVMTRPKTVTPTGTTPTLPTTTTPSTLTLTPGNMSAISIPHGQTFTVNAPADGSSITGFSQLGTQSVSSSSTSGSASYVFSADTAGSGTLTVQWFDPTITNPPGATTDLRYTQSVIPITVT